MKVRATRETLAEALSTARPAVRTTAPFVVLELTPSGLIVATDNFDIQISTRLDDVWSGDDEAPPLAVPHRPLAELVGHLTTEEVEMADEDGKLLVRSGNTDMALPLADWHLPERKIPESAPVDINPEDWAVVHRITAYCSDEENRPNLQSVFFDDDMVGATDTYRLAAYDLKTGMTAKIPASMIPRVGDKVDKVTLAADDYSIRITVGPTVTFGRTIAAEAPKWRKLLDEPPKSEVAVTLDAENLLEALARVQIPSREVIGGRAVKFEPLGEDTLLLASDDIAVDMLGHCEEVVPILEGEMPFALQLNSRHLAEAVELVGSSRIELRLSSPRSPVFLGREDLRVLVMPVVPLTYEPKK